MKILVAVSLTAAIASGTVLCRSLTRSTSHALTSAPRATALRADVRVVAVRPRGSNATIVTRDRDQRIATIEMTDANGARTRDGHRLAASSVRPGDRVRVLGGGLMEDLSQRTVQLTGTVGSVSYPGGSPMTVKIGSQQAIVVDIAGATRVVGSSGSTSGTAIFEDADKVSISGILDETLGEMTQTSAITWLGPSASQPGTSIAG
ncbi:MAG: hypothetical protein NVSMB22_01530 [Chloroflexota bacterium]